MYKFSLIIFLVFSFSSFAFAELDKSRLPNDKITKHRLYLTAKEAYEMKTSQPEKVFFVDVRSWSELEFVGMTDVVDMNIPYAFNNFNQWDAGKQRFRKKLNRDFPFFLEDSLKKVGLDKDSKIILMCRSGKRSALAANLLHDFKYTNVYTVIDGFEGDKAKEGSEQGKHLVNGWKNSDLPWSYRLNREKLVLP